MIPPFENILFETRFGNRVYLISKQVQYLENQFDSTFTEVHNQVSINTYHLARDQQQISRLTENYEILMKEVLRVSESIAHVKSNIKVLADRQVKFEKNINGNLAALSKKVDSLTKQFESLSIN